MGIPKFYRYIAQRWPSIQQEINAYDSIPEYDNLYLDMNSILHNCTRSQSLDIKLSEEQVCQKIFAYIDHLFNLINPKDTFYMAIDGVAPRAKMNQQRARRFRAAQEAEEEMQKAIEEGTYIPPTNDTDVFDKNAITPGTEFMAKLTEQLKYFIHKKVSTDAAWQKINVIFSGHEVPGEGEHKIMEYIRALRTAPDYNHSTRHCIYGLDADLIMLGLITHEPYLSILREEVLFGKEANAASKLTLEQQKFYLLHISVVREYLKLEFDILVENMTFDYNFERVLDDFIFSMFVIGNDFLPHLPDLHLNHGAFDYILAGFKHTLKNIDGYLTENGVIDFSRFGKWLEVLERIERASFEKEDIDLAWFNSKIIDLSLERSEKRKETGQSLMVKEQKKIIGLLKKWFTKVAQQPITNDYFTNPPSFNLNENGVIINSNSDTIELLKTLGYKLGFNLVHSQSQDTYSFVMFIEERFKEVPETKEEMEERVKLTRQIFKLYEHSDVFESEEVLRVVKDTMENRFTSWKSQYYKEKIDFNSIEHPEKVIDMAENYAEGLQWVLFYYYRGCPSWNWYYRYHYAPRTSDLAMGFQNNFEFEESEPVKPFVQLMSVLPVRSKKLVPAPYRTLMTDEFSPIKDCYPNHVDYDLNGKKQLWEAVVLISFVDMNKIAAALESLNNQLTEEETKRNTHGTDLIFIFSPQIDQIYRSPLGGIFKNLEHNHCLEQKFVLNKYLPEEIVSGLIHGVATGKHSFSAFPSIHYLDFDYELKANDTKVFNFPSKDASVVLTFNKEKDLGLDNVTLIGSYLGSTVYTRYPFVRPSKVVSIRTKEGKYESVHGKPVLTPYKNANQFGNDVSRMVQDLKRTKAFVLPTVRMIFDVQPTMGVVRKPDGSYSLIFEEAENRIESYPYELVVKTVSSIDSRFEEKDAIPIDQEFPIGSSNIFLGDYAYGSEAIVTGFEDDKLKLKLDLTNSNDSKTRLAARDIANEDMKSIEYLPSHKIAKMFKFSPLTISRMLDRCLVSHQGRNLDVGLGIKNENRHTKALGFSKKTTNWFYSTLTVSVLNEYKSKFSGIYNHVVDTLNAVKAGSNIPNIVLDSVVTNVDELNAFKLWINDFKNRLVVVSIESESLSRKALKAIEDLAIANETESSGDQKTYKNLAKVPVEAAFDPERSLGLLRTQKFSLGDRVVYVQPHGKIPHLSKGTVVGYFSEGFNFSIEVIFDSEMLSGSTLDNRLRTHRAIMLDRSLLLNITNRQFIYQSKSAVQHDKEKSLNNTKKSYAKSSKNEKGSALLNAIQNKKSSKKSNAGINNEIVDQTNTAESEKKLPNSKLQSGNSDSKTPKKKQNNKNKKSKATSNEQKDKSVLENKENVENNGSEKSSEQKPQKAKNKKSKSKTSKSKVAVTKKNEEAPAPVVTSQE